MSLDTNSVRCGEISLFDYSIFTITHCLATNGFTCIAGERDQHHAGDMHKKTDQHVRVYDMFPALLGILIRINPVLVECKV